ncbi:MAG: hypothetical protein ACM3X9_06890 [Bacillota bacterium]
MFEIITVAIVLLLFGAAALYASKIEKHLEGKYAEKRRAMQKAKEPRKTAAEGSGKSKERKRVSL